MAEKYEDGFDDDGDVVDGGKRRKGKRGEIKADSYKGKGRRKVRKRREGGLFGVGTPGIRSIGAERSPKWLRKGVLLLLHFVSTPPLRS